MTPAVVMAASAPAWRLDRDGEGIVLRLSAELQKIEATAKPIGRLRVDTRRVGRWDSALVAFVCLLDARIELDVTGLPDAFQLLALARTDRAALRESRGRPPMTPEVSQWTTNTTP